MHTKNIKNEQTAYSFNNFNFFNLGAIFFYCFVPESFRIQAVLNFNYSIYDEPVTLDYLKKLEKLGFKKVNFYTVHAPHDASQDIKDEVLRLREAQDDFEFVEFLELVFLYFIITVVSVGLLYFGDFWILLAQPDWFGDPEATCYNGRTYPPGWDFSNLERNFLKKNNLTNPLYLEACLNFHKLVLQKPNMHIPGIQIPSRVLAYLAQLILKYNACSSYETRFSQIFEQWYHDIHTYDAYTKRPNPLCTTRMGLIEEPEYPRTQFRYFRYPGIDFLFSIHKSGVAPIAENPKYNLVLIQHQVLWSSFIYSKACFSLNRAFSTPILTDIFNNSAFKIYKRPLPAKSALPYPPRIIRNRHTRAILTYFDIILDSLANSGGSLFNFWSQVYKTDANMYYLLTANTDTFLTFSVGLLNLFFDSYKTPNNKLAPVLIPINEIIRIRAFFIIPSLFGRDNPDIHVAIRSFQYLMAYPEEILILAHLLEKDTYRGVIANNYRYPNMFLNPWWSIKVHHTFLSHDSIWQFSIPKNYISKGRIYAFWKEKVMSEFYYSKNFPCLTNSRWIPDTEVYPSAITKSTTKILASRTYDLLLKAQINPKELDYELPTPPPNLFLHLTNTVLL